MGNSPRPRQLPGSSGVLDASSVLGTLLESVPCGVLAFDGAGDLRVASTPLAAMLGMPPEQLRSLQTFEAIVAELAPRFTAPEPVAKRWLEHYASGEANWDELELTAPPRKVLERFGRPIVDAAGQRQGWIEVYRDVTVQRLMENKLFHNERMVALGQLVSSVAHEISNPLTSILGYAQRLLSRRDTLSGAGEPQYILQEAERASRIARNLLLFARGAKLERAPVDLNEVVQRTMSLRTYELSVAGIRVHLNLDPALPPLLGDSAQLQQVVLNLVTNAEQALDPTRGRARIWLRTRRALTGRIALDVTDDGTGIAPELVPHIFDPFFTTKPPGIGTGIGLSIVRGIVQEHGGEVSVQSHPGQGAMFTVEFPAASGVAFALPQIPVRPVPLSQPSPSQPVARDSRSRHILVIEDEPTVARLIADVLTDDGHVVEILLDSRAGLERLREKSYDLLICDLRMPHLDGRALYGELQKMASPLVRRLVFVTGDMLLPSTVEFLETSGVLCLPKPFLVEELREIVARAFAAAAIPASAEVS